MYWVYGNSWYINGGPLFGGGPLLGGSVVGGSTIIRMAREGYGIGLCVRVSVCLREV